MDKAGLVGKNLLQGKNVYKEGRTWFALLLAPKTKCFLLIKKLGVIDEHKTFKRFTNVSDFSDRKEYFSTDDGGKLIAKYFYHGKNFSNGRYSSP